jgi:hypothetical protein
VVDGRQGPHDGGAAVGEGERLGGALQVPRRAGPATGQQAGDPEHHRRGVDADDRRGPPGGAPGGGAGAAADVDDVVVGADAGQPDGEVGVGATPDGEAERHGGAAEAGEPRVVGVVVRGQVVCRV